MAYVEIRPWQSVVSSFRPKRKILITTACLAVFKADIYSIYLREKYFDV